MPQAKDKNGPDLPANPGGARVTGSESGGEPSASPGRAASLDRPGGDAPPERVEPKLVKDAGRTTAPAVAGGPVGGASALENSGALPLDFESWFGVGNDNVDEAADEGYGPKVVILSTGVSGPGGGPHKRGQVVALSLILGPKLMKDDNKGPGHVRRYLRLGAFRPADAEEAKVDFVKLPETETEKAETAEAERAKRVEAEERVRQLERELEEMRAAQGTGGGSSVDAAGLETIDR